MSNHSIIEHRANYHFIKMEEDYIAICSNGEKPPHCKALVLAVLEHWMNTKRDKGEKEWIYLSMPQWIKYTYMIYERNVITDSLSELMAEGFVEREPIIMYSQKTFVYRLNIKNIQKAIRALPEKSDQEIMPNLDAYVAYKERAKKRAQARREEKEEGVGDKSRTYKKTSKRVREKSTRVGDKSRTVREKSPKVREKSTQLIYTKIPSNSTEIENALSSIDETRTLSSSSNSSPSITDEAIPSQAPSSEQRDTTQPLGEENGTSEPALPEIEAQREKEASAQANGVSDSQKNTGKPGNGSRKPRKPAVSDDQRKRIDHVYEVFDLLARDVTKDESYRYQRTKSDDEHILNWFKCSPTEGLLDKVYRKLWSTPKDERTGFDWKENMTIRAVLRQYDRLVLGIKANEQNVSTNTKQIVETVANIAGYTQKTVDLALNQQDAPAMRHLGPRRNRKGA